MSLPEFDHIDDIVSRLDYSPREKEPVFQDFSDGTKGLTLHGPVVIDNKKVNARTVLYDNGNVLVTTEDGVGNRKMEKSPETIRRVRRITAENSDERKFIDRVYPGRMRRFLRKLHFPI